MRINLGAVPSCILDACLERSVWVFFSFIVCMHMSVHLLTLLYFLFGVSMVSFGSMYISGQFL